MTMPAKTLRRAGEAELGCTDAERFALELEFVQCLANPQYLNWLAQNRFLDDPAFLNYLKYLHYWKDPQYAKFIVYPHALYFLDLLQSQEFRTAIANPTYKEHVHSQQYFFWQHWRANRLKEFAAEKEQQQRGEAAGAAGEQQQPWAGAAGPAAGEQQGAVAGGQQQQGPGATVPGDGTGAS